jgi:hypothetical protein
MSTVSFIATQTAVDLGLTEPNTQRTSVQHGLVQQDPFDQRNDVLHQLQLNQDCQSRERERRD